MAKTLREKEEEENGTKEEEEAAPNLRSPQRKSMSELIANEDEDESAKLA